MSNTNGNLEENTPDYMDLKPLILRKKKVLAPHVLQDKERSIAHAKKMSKLDGDDPDPPKLPSLTFRIKLMQARTAKGYDRKTLAQKINVPESVIANYENGTVKPERTVLNKLTRVLGVALSP